MADLTFYSSIRQGAALAITRPDGPPITPAVAHVQLPVNLSYPAEASQPGSTPASATLSLLGPGDIVGLDTRTIVRTFPQPNDNNAEAGFLCYLDFDQVDLPWRYTPATNAAGTDQLRPWLTLVVLAEGTEFDPTNDVRPPQGDEKLPQLNIGHAGLLPDLTQVWAWAHVQGQQAQTDSDLAKTISGAPGALVARLMSPRNLMQKTAYTAFLVPTFRGGVLAGQGQDTSGTDGLALAWQGTGTPPLQLPVYHSWRFQTGSVSSFQQAVSELSPVETLPPTVGLRGLDVSNPGLTLPPAATDQATPPNAIPISMGGALQTPAQAMVPDPQTLSNNWLVSLGQLIDQAAAQPIPIVAPPMYGRWYAAQDHLDFPGIAQATNPPWFSVLNQDPRFRVAAGLGTEVVERDQQSLMAEAQTQASVLNTVNRRRKVMQAGREVFTSVFERHLQGTIQIPEEILLVTAYLHGKILSCTGGGPPTPTLGPIITNTPLGGSPFPSWRRPFRFPPFGPMVDGAGHGKFMPMTQDPPNGSTPGTAVTPSIPGGLPDGPIITIIDTMSSDQRLYWGVVIFWVARKLLSTQGGKYWWLLRRLLRLGLDLIQLGSTAGVANLAILQKLRDGTLLGADILALPPASNFASVTQLPDPVLSDPNSWPLPRQPSTGPKDSPDAAAFRTAAAALFDFVNGAPLPGRQIPALDIPGTVTCILNALQPEVTFVTYEQFIHVNLGTLVWEATDQLEPILTPPAVVFPMWQRLAAISNDWILPNVSDVPLNSVSLLETNQRFIEAFMVGLNHQINRELLWNGYPTDQRGTIFQQFWDPSGWNDASGGVGVGRNNADFFDITEVRGWNPTSALGSHTGRSPSVEHLVLLVRGDLIKRYPTSLSTPPRLSPAVPPWGSTMTTRSTRSFRRSSPATSPTTASS
jgi:hypothetical protein